MTLSDEIKAMVSTLEMQLNGFAKAAYEKDLRIAELEALYQEAFSNNRATRQRIYALEHAAPSAPAVEQQPVAQMICPTCGKDRFKEPCPSMADECPMIADAHLLAAPPAADTDKVREAISDEQIMRIAGDVRQRNAGAWPGDVAFARAVLASMAAQAPVREVPGWQPIETAPKDGREILVRYPKQGNVKQIGNFNTIHKHWESKGARMWAVEQQCEWHPLPADLPATPVQQEGEKP